MGSFWGKEKGQGWDVATRHSYHNSTEQVLGTKVIEGLGRLKLLGAGTEKITAVDNLKITFRQ